MFRWLFALLACAFVLPSAAQMEPHGEAVAARVHFENRATLRRIVDLKRPWTINRELGFALMPLTTEEWDLLESMGLRLEIDRHYTQLLNQPAPPWEGQAGIPGFPCYQTVEETLAFANDLVAAWPHLAELNDIGDSWEKQQNPDEGYDLMVLRLTNRAKGGDKPKLLIITGLHAREYAPVGIASAFASRLLEQYGQEADATWLLDDHEIHLVLHANPDGRKMAEQGILWRKNKNNDFCTGTNNRGVDLNRNFPFMWGCCGGSSGGQCQETYRGPAAESEPETQMVVDYARSIFPDQRNDDPSDPAPDDATGVFLDIHSFGGWVLWPYGYDDVPTPNGTALQTLGRKFAFFNGYWPEKASVSFDTDGTTDDFAYGDLGVAAYTFEVGDWFFQNCATFQNSIQPDNLEALMYAAKAARTPYLTSSGPDAVNPTPDCDQPALGDLVYVSVVIDDTRFSTRNGTEPDQLIAGASAYLDTPPWETGATALSLNPIDGSLDTNSEVMELVLDTSDLALGRHTLYFQGQDANGSSGAVSAVFINIRPSFLLSDWPAQASVLDLIPFCPAQ